MAATALPFSRTYLILALAALAPALLLSSTPPANRAPTQTLHRGRASPTSRAPTNVRGGATAVKPPPERLECRELGLRDGLLKQHDELLKQHGERLTIMCVGEAGLGKSSLISNIFTLPIGPAQSLKKTKEISKTVCHGYYHVCCTASPSWIGLSLVSLDYAINSSRANTFLLTQAFPPLYFTFENS
jgi:hypothetical protein